MSAILKENLLPWVWLGIRVLGKIMLVYLNFLFFSFRGQEVKLINRRHLILAIRSIKNRHSHVSHLLARCLRQPLQQTEVDPVHLVTRCHIAPILLSLMANSCEWKGFIERKRYRYNVNNNQPPLMICKERFRDLPCWWSKRPFYCASHKSSAL